VLHTALAGHPAHAPYAPCSIPELAAKGYDYWALGHVHDHAVLHTAPHIVFPGNLQGRHIRETGPKGAVLVEVDDGVVSRLTHLPLDVVRWARVEVDCAGAEDMEAVHGRVRLALTEARAREADGRPMVARVSLRGDTPLHGALRDGSGALRDDIRVVAAQVSQDLWIEKISVGTRARMGDDPPWRSATTSPPC
jgi:DNA repair exonuclease SbcCD nuclease subunit